MKPREHRPFSGRYSLGGVVACNLAIGVPPPGNNRITMNVTILRQLQFTSNRLVLSPQIS